MSNEVKVTGTSTVPSVLNDRIKAQPDLIAIIEGDTRLTYKEFGKRVHHTAAALQDLGIQKGEKVALIFENGIQFPVVLFAVYQVGAVPLSVNPTLKPGEIRHILSDSETVAVVVSENFRNSRLFDYLYYSIFSGILKTHLFGQAVLLKIRRG